MLKTITLDFKTLQEVKDYCDKEKLPVAGEKELGDILKNPDKYPELRDDNFHFFFDDVYTYHDGLWYVPNLRWLGSGFNRHADWLGLGWRSNYRVVLIDDTKPNSTHCPQGDKINKVTTLFTLKKRCKQT